MAQLTYKIRLQKEPEGGYTVMVPALPGCITYGVDIDEAIAMAKEAIELNIESLAEHAKKFPPKITRLSIHLLLPLTYPNLHEQKSICYSKDINKIVRAKRVCL